MKYFLALIGGTVGLLILVAAAKFGFEHEAAPRTSGIGGERRCGSIDYLFVGSSHTRQSYDVRVLEQQTSGSAFLVAYNGMDFRELRTVLPALLTDESRRPKVLIIEGYGVSLVRAQGMEDSRLFFDAPPRLKWTLLQQLFAVEPHPQSWLDAFDLLANRNNELLLTYPVESRLVDGLSYRGGYVGKTVPGLKTFAGLAIPDESNQPRPDELAALRAAIAEARAARIRLACLGSPMPGPVERQPSIQALTRRLGAIMQTEGIAYLDGARGFPVDDPRLFADSNHLSSAGRELYTERAAEFLSRTFPISQRSLAAN